MEEGFRLLMSEHQERIYAQVRGMVQSHEDASDVVQNIFIKVYGAIKGFEGKSKISTWLYRIAANESLTFLKRNQKRQTSSNSYEHLALVKADVFVEESEITALLKSAMQNLPERQKMIFNLRYFDELTYEEISKILNVKTGGLKASFHHAVKKIKAYVKENQVT